MRQLNSEMPRDYVLPYLKSTDPCSHSGFLACKPCLDLLSRQAHISSSSFEFISDFGIIEMSVLNRQD